MIKTLAEMYNSELIGCPPYHHKINMKESLKICGENYIPYHVQLCGQLGTYSRTYTSQT